MFSIPTPGRADISQISHPGPSHISRVPPEILGEIFLRCLWAESASRKTQPLLLSSVCRLWRTLVLANPALWASLKITYNVGIWGLCPPLPVIRAHLQRSRTHPLSFYLRAKYGDSSELFPVLTTLITARQRWCDVHIELFTMMQEILDLITLGDAPMLRSIRCDLSFFTVARMLPTPLRMIDNCPHLESFQWGGSESLDLPPLLPLSTTQLTSLSLGTGLSVLECITILRLSPRLSSVKFCYIVRGPAITPHLIHPALCTLTAEGEHFTTLLASLTLPALLDLTLAIGRTGWDIALSAFLTRSEPSLRKLSLHVTNPHEPALLHILASTPHLRVLKLSSFSIDSIPFTAMLIRALHPLPPPGAFLCPNLRSLRISPVEGCPDGLCSAMLRARWGTHARANGVACLEEGDIGVALRKHDRENMMELRAEGMRMMRF